MGDADLTFAREINALQKGELKQIRHYILDLTSTGITPWVEMPATALTLVRRLCPAGKTKPDTQAWVTSNTGYAWIQINQEDNPWLRCSLVAASEDRTSFTLTINRFRFNVTAAHAGEVLVWLAHYSFDTASSVGGASSSGGFGTSGSHAG